MEQEDTMDHEDLQPILAAPSYPAIEDIISIKSEIANDDRFTLYVFRGHSQSLFSGNRKEVAVIGFLRDKFQVDITNVPGKVLKSCLQCYVCQEEESNLTNFGKIIEATKIYRHQLKYMQDYSASLRSLIQDQELVIQNLIMRYDAGLIQKHIDDGNLEMIRKAEALAQRSTWENYKLRQMIAQIPVLVCQLLCRYMQKG